MAFIIGCLVIISAALTIYGKYSPNNAIVYACKPLTTLLIISIAVINSIHFHNPVMFFVLAGLIFSLLGDVFLLKSTLFLYGLIAFLIAHLLFIIGFLEVNRASHVLLVLPFIVGAIILFAYLYPDLSKYKYPALIYIIVIALMSWRAWECYMGNKNTGAFEIGIASLLFIFSDANLAINKFKKPYKSAQLVILSTYYLSIWLIASQFNKL